MPVAIDQIRKLGRRGHHVVAADTFDDAPGGHSRYANVSGRVASPRFATERFVEDVGRLIRDEDIDVVLPAFEEGYFLAEHRDELPPSAHLFCPPLATLVSLHDKVRFVDMAHELGIRVPPEIVVTSASDLPLALRAFERWVAKPAFSRGGVELFSNADALASMRRPRECNPTPEHPWVVQQFIEGVDVCTYTIARAGHVRAHTTYVHPREIEHAGGIVFHSVDDPEALELAERVVERWSYDGQISLDFRRDEHGLVALECNPRPTAGIHLMTDEAFEDALLGADPHVRVTPAGVRRMYASALFRDMALHWSSIEDDLRHLFSGAEEVVATWDDPLPAFYQFLSYRLVFDYRRRVGAGRRPTDLAAAYFDHVAWDGPAHGPVA
jgi:predicted ATP-grasp superfamily ATP-dependent carboligase